MLRGSNPAGHMTSGGAKHFCKAGFAFFILQKNIFRKNVKHYLRREASLDILLVARYFCATLKLA